VVPQVMESGPITKVFQYILIRNSNRFQVYQVSQILLVSSSGSMGVPCLQSPLFESWWRRYAVTHMYLYRPCFSKNSENLRSSKKSLGFSEFPKNRIEKFRLNFIYG